MSLKLNKFLFSVILMGIFFNYLINFFDDKLAFDQQFKSFYLILSVILGLGFYLIISFCIKAFQLDDIKLKY